MEDPIKSSSRESIPVDPPNLFLPPNSFPSMVPLQGALPNMVSQSSIHHTSSLGTLSPSWMPAHSSNPLAATSTIQRTSSLGTPSPWTPTQSSNPLPSTSTIQRTSSLGTPSPWMAAQSSHPLSHCPIMPSGQFTGQVAPNMPPPCRPQAAGGFGPFNLSLQQSGGNPFD